MRSVVSAEMTPPEPLSPAEALQLDRVLRELAHGPVTAGWLAIDSRYEAELTAGEASLVERAVPKRRSEFATGRRLLRDLLSVDVEILQKPSRAPLLPDGTVASLSHDSGIALGVVAPASDMAAVGVDVEIDTVLSDDMAAVILRSDDVAPDAITAFVAKEAAYKTWSSLGGEMLEHHDVRVSIDDDHYSAVLRDERTVEGRIARAAGRIVALVCVANE